MTGPLRLPRYDTDRERDEAFCERDTIEMAITYCVGDDDKGICDTYSVEHKTRGQLEAAAVSFQDNIVFHLSSQRLRRRRNNTRMLIHCSIANVKEAGKQKNDIMNHIRFTLEQLSVNTMEPLLDPSSNPYFQICGWVKELKTPHCTPANIV